MGDNLHFVKFEKEEKVLPEVTLAMGNYHTCAIDEDGTLACWGLNANGQLGLGGAVGQRCVSAEVNYDCKKTPGIVNLGVEKRAMAVAADYAQTCAILDDGSLKCWGDNNGGQLGVAEIVMKKSSPTTVTFSGGKSVKSISLGETHTCTILSDDSLVCWGTNIYGQLGVNDTTLRNSPAQPVTFADDKMAVVMATGGNHTCAILDDGSLACWGSNNSGQLGATGRKFDM